jgi:hypothetical protein
MDWSVLPRLMHVERGMQARYEESAVTGATKLGKRSEPH